MCFEDLQSYVLKDVYAGTMVMKERKRRSDLNLTDNLHLEIECSRILKEFAVAKGTTSSGE